MSYQKRPSSYQRYFQNGAGQRNVIEEAISVSVASKNKNGFMMQQQSEEVAGDDMMLVACLETSELRQQEKDDMKNLNSRLADFIKKVRTLEGTNKALEIKLAGLDPNPKRIADMYESEMERLRKIIEDCKNNKVKFLITMDNIHLEIDKLTSMWKNELKLRRDLEKDLQKTHKDCDDATFVRADLENAIDGLRQEIIYLNKTHDEQVADLHDRLRNTQIKIQSAPGPDLEALLEEMRVQYENMNKRNHDNTEKQFKQKVSDLQESASRNDKALRTVQEEMKISRKSLQVTSLDMKSLRATNEALVRNIASLEDRLSRDIEKYESEILVLNNDSHDLKREISDNLRQYQQLMGVKHTLDREIASYRKLLGGEDSRIVDYIVNDQSKSSVTSTAQIIRKTSTTNVNIEDAGTVKSTFSFGIQKPI